MTDVKLWWSLPYMTLLEVWSNQAATDGEPILFIICIQIKGALKPKCRDVLPLNAIGTVRMEDFLELYLGQRDLWEYLLVWERKGKMGQKRFKEMSRRQKNRQKSIWRKKCLEKGSSFELGIVWKGLGMIVDAFVRKGLLAFMHKIGLHQDGWPPSISFCKGNNSQIPFLIWLALAKKKIN